MGDEFYMMGLMLFLSGGFLLYFVVRAHDDKNHEKSMKAIQEASDKIDRLESSWYKFLGLLSIFCPATQKVASACDYVKKEEEDDKSSE